MKTLHLNAVSFQKDGVEKTLHGIVEPEKPWVLKGMITNENKDGGCAVDLSGCEELIIKGSAVSSVNNNLYANSTQIIYQAFTSSRKACYGYWRDSLFGFDCIVCKGETNQTPINFSTNIIGYSQVNGRKVSDLNIFKLGDSTNVTECNIEIYAR